MMAYLPPRKGYSILVASNGKCFARPRYIFDSLALRLRVRRGR